MVLSGISFVTTLPAPITTLFPIVTPGIIIAPPPIQTLSPIITGAVCVLQNSNEPSSLDSPNRSNAFVGEMLYISVHLVQLRHYPQYE